ncbi:MAG: dihydrofolate reductase family protein [Cyanobacteria bacterium TGS_CYA1]|nr:dihydrofolate reductase family protein [Cyanobacteria bacterium TGS_CYA1]
MPKIIVNEFLTLDGVMQAPGGPDEDKESGFKHGGWQFPYDDKVMEEKIGEGFDDADGFLLGRKTYDIFSSYWPKFDDPNNPIATKLNSLPKYVMSRNLKKVDWNNSTLISDNVVEELRKLREKPGRSIQTWGSNDVLQTLFKNDLIDEYRLYIFPLVLGTGKRLFGDGTIPKAFKPIECVTSPTGATYHRLASGGKPTYGKMGP